MHTIVSVFGAIVQEPKGIDRQVCNDCFGNNLFANWNYYLHSYKVIKQRFLRQGSENSKSLNSVIWSNQSTEFLTTILSAQLNMKGWSVSRSFMACNEEFCRYSGYYSKLSRRLLVSLFQRLRDNAERFCRKETR